MNEVQREDVERFEEAAQRRVGGLGPVPLWEILNRETREKELSFSFLSGSAATFPRIICGFWNVEPALGTRCVDTL